MQCFITAARSTSTSTITSIRETHVGKQEYCYCYCYCLLNYYTVLYCPIYSTFHLNPAPSSHFSLSLFLYLRSLSIIPRLVKDVVAVSPNTLATENGGEAKTLGHFCFRNVLVAAFGLSDDEFTDLEECGRACQLLHII